jgi:NAD+ synthase (glutamine-hydrolysing)
MKIVLAQMKVVPGRPDINIEKMLEMVEQAKDKSADLIVFPEMSISGYLLGDTWLDESFCNDLMTYNKLLQNASNEIAIAYGNIFIDNDINKRVKDDNYHPNKDGRTRKYNAVYIFQNGQPAERVKENNLLPKGIQPKTLLPNYRIFDDQRYFFSLEDVAKDFSTNLETLLQPFLIEIDGKKVPFGFELCEDLWVEDYRKNGQSINPTKILIRNSAEYIVNLSASPWTYGKNKARDRKIEFLRNDIKNFVPFFYVNCVGVQNNGKNIVTFDGGSTVYNKDGHPIKFAKQLHLEELIFVDDFDFNNFPLKRNEEPKIAQKYHTIINGILSVKEMAGENNDPPYVIGLSGGIDSSVVAALLVKAVGKERVLGINLPSKINSEKTKNAAKKLAKNLGILYDTINIDQLTELNKNLIDSIDPGEDGRKLTSLNLENVQAKIRGTSLISNIAAKYNALWTNNGNKVEIALGYATLYGDWGGAISPLGDLTKSEVVELAKYQNKYIFKKEVIPNELIPNDLWEFSEDQIEPSAELREKQVDPMKYGYHCNLLEALTDYKKKTPEDIMQWWLEGTLAKNLKISNKLLERYNLNNPNEFIKDLEWFNSTIKKNVFKRIQSPPIIMTSKSSYGFDIRESILPIKLTKRHLELKEIILKNNKPKEVLEYVR